MFVVANEQIYTYGNCQSDIAEVKQIVDKNPRITLWSSRSSAVFRYLRKTEPEFSISKQASILIEEAVSKKYPEIWDLFDAVNLIDKEIYQEIKAKKPTDWTPEFCTKVYQNIKEHKVFITNLGKCTQIDARPLTNNYFLDYLPLLEKEIKIIKPKIIILFGNQVSSIFLNQKIYESQTSKQYFEKKLSKETYKCFPIFYPVGNGRFNIDKSIEDINYIIKNYIEEK